MAFIITLLALIVERFFHWTHLRRWQWFVEYQTWLNKRVGTVQPYVTLALVLLPPMILVWLVEHLLSGWWFGGFRLVFEVVVVLYCLGPSNLWLQVYNCLAGLHGADVHDGIERVRQAFNIELPANPQAFHQAFTRSIFVAAHQRIFGVLFWFVVLGPAGAVLYRLLSLCCEESPFGFMTTAVQLQKILDWVPTRIFTFIFALGGNFTLVFAQWRRYVAQGLQSNEALLTDCGLAALDIMADGRMPEDGSAEKDALSLLDRVFVISLVVLAALVFVT
jgi:AmpE protein